MQGESERRVVVSARETVGSSATWIIERWDTAGTMAGERELACHVQKGQNPSLEYC